MTSITPHSPIRPDDIEESDDPYAIGRWAWFVPEDDEQERWLGCILQHGSNYVRIEGVGAGRYMEDKRVHVDDLDERLIPEDTAEEVIRNKTGYHQSEVNRLLGRVKEETAKLGVVPKTAISHRTGNEDNALAVVSEQVDTNAYKNALVKAKDEVLPELFKQVEEQHKKLAAWMKAPALPMMAQIGPMKDSIGAIEDRIYTIGLYAGLTEHAAKIKDGDPAMTETKLRVMQRLHYMDEEALLDYDIGGMEFKDIHAFDAWLSRPQNFERLLPFERTCVAFRVRRDKKEREAANIGEAWMNMMLAFEDMTTFLYVRNGEQLWRIGCDFDFGASIFPDQDRYDPANGGFMIKMWGSRAKELMSRNEYEVRKNELDEKLAEWEIRVAEWEAMPKGERSHFRPHKPSDHEIEDIEPMNPSSVYFDDAMKLVNDEVKEFNRIAVIIQGLFDRSLVLHPHPPVSVWDNASFERSVELIYDSTTLTHGDKPDFKAYCAKLRESLTEGSVVIGQERAWMQREGEKEQKRRDNDWRNRDRYSRDVELWQPYGDPGPGYVAEIEEWKPRARKATFRWEREPMRYDPFDPNKKIACSITVKADHLFNVSAYQPGDYLQFFKDPRSRIEYLKWAPLLLEAEKYHAGLLNLNKQQKG